jgi:hypothetical protein
MLKCGHVHHFKKYDKRPEFENVRNSPYLNAFVGLKALSGTWSILFYLNILNHAYQMFWEHVSNNSSAVLQHNFKQGLYDIMHDHPN